MWIFFCLVWTHYAYYYLIPFFVLFCFVLFVLLDIIGHSCKKAKNVMIKTKSPAYAITWPDISLGNTLKFLDHKDDGNFSGSGKRISITMTTAWRCAPCQRMRRIQKTQWSGSRACNLLAIIEFRCGWLRWREWDCVGVLLGRSAADRVAAATRAHASQAISASCHCNQNFCPPSGSDTHLQIRRAPRSAATWVDVIQIGFRNYPA